MKLKNLVSIKKNVMFGISKREGKIIMYNPNTKNAFPADK